MSQKKARQARQELRSQGISTLPASKTPTLMGQRRERPRGTRRTIWMERMLELFYLDEQAREAKAAAKPKRKTRSQKLADELEASQP